MEEGYSEDALRYPSYSDADQYQRRKIPRPGRKISLYAKLKTSMKPDVPMRVFPIVSMGTNGLVRCKFGVDKNYLNDISTRNGSMSLKVFGV